MKAETHYTLRHLGLYAWQTFLRGMYTVAVLLIGSADESPENVRCPPPPHPDRVVKIRETKNRFIFALCGSAADYVCHTFLELKDFSDYNINLQGGETWVRPRNHHHIGCDEEACHSIWKALFYFLPRWWNNHTDFWIYSSTECWQPLRWKHQGVPTKSTKAFNNTRSNNRIIWFCLPSGCKKLIWNKCLTLLIDFIFQQLYPVFKRALYHFVVIIFCLKSFIWGFKTKQNKTQLTSSASYFMALLHMWWKWGIL